MMYLCLLLSFDFDKCSVSVFIEPHTYSFNGCWCGKEHELVYTLMVMDRVRSVRSVFSVRFKTW